MRLNAGLIADSWNLVLALVRAGKVEIKPSPIECYKDLFGEGVEKFEGYQTTQDFVAGYGKTWTWALFNPCKRKIAGCETYCVPVDAIKRSGEGAIQELIIPFNVFIDIFKDVQIQLGTE